MFYQYLSNLHRFNLRRLLIIPFIIFYSTIFCQGVIYISDKGNDVNDGSISKPVYSLQRAFDLAKNYKLKKVNITIAKGNYFCDSPLKLDSSYANSTFSQINFIGDSSGKSIFFGGKKRIATKDNDNGLWYVDMSDVSRDNVDNLRQILTLNGSPRSISRYPDSGFDTLQNVRYDNDSFTISIPQHLNDILKDASIDQIKSIYATFYVKWTTVISFVSGYDFKSSTLTFTGKKLPELFKLKSGETHFKLENLPTVLKAGQWYYKNINTIAYMPYKNEAVEKSFFITPDQDKVIDFYNPIDKVIDINFINLSFNTWGKPLGNYGYFPHQAGANVGAIIEINNSNNINFIKNKFENITTYAFWLKNYCKDIKILTSKFYNTGAGAIKIGEYVYDSDNAAPNNITIDNNVIKFGGQVFPDAVAINIINSHSNVITHNEVSDYKYTGISLGWVWGYGKSLTRDNKISYNRIYNIGDKVLDDMGGIYTLGVSDGTIINNNVIYNINAKNYGGWGIYADEGSSNILIENNLVYSCSSAGFHQHYGQNNIIRNNIFAYNAKAQLEATIIESHNSLSFYNNIIVSNDCSFFTSNWVNINSHKYSNTYFCPNIPNTIRKELSLERNSIFFDPKLKKTSFFYDVKASFFINNRNFRKIDYSKVGIVR